MQATILYEKLAKDWDQETIATLPQNINVRDANGNTALIIACQKNNTVVAEFLIKNNADLNCKNCLADTAIIFAAYNNNEFILTELISRNCSIIDKNRWDETAAEWINIWNDSQAKQRIIDLYKYKLYQLSSGKKIKSKS